MTKTTKLPARVSEKLALLMSARVDERASLIAELDEIASIVPRLAPEELMFALRAAPRETAVTVLSHATGGQLRFLLDMEIWTGEEVDPAKAALMLSMMDDCGIKRLERWLKTLDAPDLAALTGRLATGSFAGEDGMPDKDPGKGKSSFTLDGVHFITTDAELSPRLQRFLMLLRSADAEKYTLILEIIFSGFDVEDEETAARFRRARLAERGFPDLDEARRIYAKLAPEKFASMEPRKNPGDRVPADGYEAPLYPATLAPRPALLRSLLDGLAGSEDGGEVMLQLARLTNLAVTADALDLADTGSFQRGALKVSGYLTIALETLYGRDEGAMGSALESAWLEDLFRVGATRVAKGASSARAFYRDGWPKGDKKRLGLLGEELSETILALLPPAQKYAVFTPEGPLRRDFSTLAELVASENAVKMGELAGRFVSECLGVDLSSLEDARKEGGFAEIFLTSAANGALGRGLVHSPIERSIAPKAVQLLMEGAKSAPGGVPLLVKHSLSWACGKLNLTDAEKAVLSEYLEGAVAGFREEFRGFQSGADIDPRFIRGLWIGADG